MRKLVLQMHITLDGFVATPEGQLNWMSMETDQKHMALLQKLTDSVDTILMGRKMVKDFTTYWESVADNEPDSPEYPYAKIFVDTPKIVFSKTVSSLPGKNVRVENGDLVMTVNELKKQPGKNMIVYGGANFVAQLIKNNLIDELYLFTNPVAIGNGLRIFDSLQKLELFHSEAFSNGIVANGYRPAK